VSGLKTALLKTLTLPGAKTSLSPFRAGHASIFMLHRFHSPEFGVEGHDPTALRVALAYLRKSRYEVLSLGDLFRRLNGDGRPLSGAVAFTIDDGYLDHAHVAAPIFAEFDCPVTTFVTSGFLDGMIWFWWDQIEFAFRQTSHKSASVPIGAGKVDYRWESVAERDGHQFDFTARCKEIPNGEKLTAIQQLAQSLEVDLPAKAPSQRYGAMSWEDLRKAERGGMTFGPHTVTHPVLSRTDDTQSSHELRESWRRLKEETSNAVPVFCYPNGRFKDFSQREIGTLKDLGFLGAVVGESGYASARRFDETPSSPFGVQRFPYPEDLGHFLQVVTGLERVKSIVRERSWR
jgi:peptidoglycan/xylan/chitin deacetylase (PgdA/CDA1 family)